MSGRVAQAAPKRPGSNKRDKASFPTVHLPVTHRKKVFVNGAVQNSHVGGRGRVVHIIPTPELIRTGPSPPARLQECLGDVLRTASSAVLHLHTSSPSLPDGVSTVVSDGAQDGKTQPWSLPNVVACLAQAQYDALQLTDVVEMQIHAHAVKHFGAGRVRFLCHIAGGDCGADFVSVWFFSFLDSDAKLLHVRESLKLDSERGSVCAHSIHVAKIAEDVYFAVDLYCVRRKLQLN
jgi:hypothetical protein